VAETCLTKRAEQLVQAGVVPSQLPELVHKDLAATDAEIRPGISVPGDTRTQGQTAAALAEDIEAFRESRRLARVVVINVASTEPPCQPHPAHDSLAALEDALSTGADVLPASSLYAYAALKAGCAYVDFTPSTGARLPALDELAAAAARPLPHVRLPGQGRDAL
jgi:myo-inositol-1-phosphate synthase